MNIQSTMPNPKIQAKQSQQGQEPPKQDQEVTKDQYLDFYMDSLDDNGPTMVAAGLGLTGAVQGYQMGGYVGAAAGLIGGVYAGSFIGKNRPAARGGRCYFGWIGYSRRNSSSRDALKNKHLRWKL